MSRPMWKLHELILDILVYMPALTHASAIINRRLFCVVWVTEICRSMYCISWASFVQDVCLFEPCFLRRHVLVSNLLVYLCRVQDCIWCGRASGYLGKSKGVYSFLQYDANYPADFEQLSLLASYAHSSFACISIYRAQSTKKL